ncbi:MAG: hypothetical protein ABI140_18310 [Jatrophihabitantaceae bacterium]
MANGPGLREQSRCRAHLGRGRTARTHKGGPAAFDWFARHRLAGLGVAFASKYLYFCDVGNTAQPALVLDRLVSDWLARNAGWRPRLDWNRHDYRAYVEAMIAWATEIGIAPHEVEQLIFQNEAARDPRSQWALPPATQEISTIGISAPAASDGEAVDIDVLEVLELTSEAFAALPHMRPEDRQDAEAHLRHLRRIAVVYLDSQHA